MFIKKKQNKFIFLKLKKQKKQTHTKTGHLCKNFKN